MRLEFQVVRVKFRDHLMVRASSPDEFISKLTNPASVAPIEFTVWGLKTYEDDVYVGISPLVPLTDVRLHTELPLCTIYILKSAVVEEVSLRRDGEQGERQDAQSGANE